MYFYIEEKNGRIEWTPIYNNFWLETHAFFKKRNRMCHVLSSILKYRWAQVSVFEYLPRAEFYLLNTTYCVYILFSWTMHSDKYSGLVAFFLCTYKHIFVDMKYNSAGYLSFLVCVTSLFYEIIVHQKSWKNNIWPFYT